MLITISDLHRIQSDRNQQISSYADRNSHLQEQLQQVIHQWHLGLPIQLFLDADPVLAQLVYQVQTLLPNLFKPNKKLYLHTPISTILNVEAIAHTIQVDVNLGFRHGIPKLFEWGVRSPELNWRDLVKLWTVAQHFAIAPSDLKLIVIALHPDQMAQKVVHIWNDELHQQTQEWLMMQLSVDENQSQATVVNEHESDPLWAAISNLEAIAEVVI
ncbi:MAG: hypothetical protein NW224_12900 [Leptolyngbyaceae cyanobacterium bins.302]|nr:hypothetical protein [Leptolyngbyaceae cyanobacterium bins.302]